MTLYKIDYTFPRLRLEKHDKTFSFSSHFPFQNAVEETTIFYIQRFWLEIESKFL